MKLIQWLFIIQRLDIISGYPVHGGWTVWGNPKKVGQCSVSCGFGHGKVSVAYYRSCTSPKPKNGGKKCVGAAITNHLHSCVTIKKCPIHGHWGKWMVKEIGVCSVTCGKGVTQKTRIRACDDPPPGYGGNECKPPESETVKISCNPDLSCADSNNPSRKSVNGGWNEWKFATEGRCSVTCGSGTKQVYEQRQCDKPTPMHGGLFCVGSQVQSKIVKCEAEALCDVNGGWGAWGPPITGQCPVTCGQGVQINVRKRMCDDPKPKPGHKCLGENSMTELVTCEPGIMCIVEGDSATLTPSYQVSESKTTLYIGIVVPIIIIICLAVGGIYYFRKNSGKMPTFKRKKRSGEHGHEAAKTTHSPSPTMGAKSTLSSSPTKQSMAKQSTISSPKSNISHSPAMASPKSNMSHSPTKQSMASPKSNMSHSPAKQSMASPKSNMSHSPAKQSME